MTSSNSSFSSHTLTGELRSEPVTMYDAKDSDPELDEGSEIPPPWDEDMDPPLEAFKYFYRRKRLDRVHVTTIQTRTFSFPVNEYIPRYSDHLKTLLSQPPSPSPLPTQGEPISLYLSITTPGDKILTITNESPIVILCLFYHCYDYFSRGMGHTPDPYIDVIIEWGLETSPQLLSLYDLAIRYSYTDLHRRLRSYLITSLQDEWSEDRFAIYLLSLWRIQTFQSNREGVTFRDQVLAIGAQHYETLKDHKLFTSIIEDVPSEAAAYILWAVRGDSDAVEAWYPGQWFAETVIGETRRDTDIRMQFWDKEWDFSAFKEVCWDQSGSGSFSTSVEFLAIEGLGGFFEDDVGEVSPRTLSFPAIPAFSVAVGSGGSDNEEQSGEEVRVESRMNPCSRLRKWCSSIRFKRLRSS